MYIHVPRTKTAHSLRPLSSWHQYQTTSTALSRWGSCCCHRVGTPETGRLLLQQTRKLCPLDFTFSLAVVIFSSLSVFVIFSVSTTFTLLSYQLRFLVCENGRLFPDVFLFIIKFYFYFNVKISFTGTHCQFIVTMKPTVLLLVSFLYLFQQVTFALRIGSFNVQGFGHKKLKDKFVLPILVKVSCVFLSFHLSFVMSILRARQ